ncbi:hypothetical protein Q7P37_004710 [Cladosporium fusiforme]
MLTGDTGDTGRLIYPCRARLAAATLQAVVSHGRAYETDCGSEDANHEMEHSTLQTQMSDDRAILFTSSNETDAPPGRFTQRLSPKGLRCHAVYAESPGLRRRTRTLGPWFSPDDGQGCPTAVALLLWQTVVVGQTYQPDPDALSVWSPFLSAIPPLGTQSGGSTTVYSLCHTTTPLPISPFTEGLFGRHNNASRRLKSTDRQKAATTFTAILVPEI